MRTHSRFEPGDPAAGEDDQQADDPPVGEGFESRDSDGGDALVIKEEQEEEESS
jgi:hypothetical protein